MTTAFIYAYRVKDAEKFSLNPNELHVAYQVDDPLFRHQCDWGRDFTRHFLRKFKDDGGKFRLVQNQNEFIIPLPEWNNPVFPFPEHLLKEWELSDILDTSKPL